MHTLHPMAAQLHLPQLLLQVLMLLPKVLNRRVNNHTEYG